MHHQLRAQFDVRAKPLRQQPLDIGQTKYATTQDANATGSTKRSMIERNIASPNIQTLSAQR